MTLETHLPPSIPLGIGVVEGIQRAASAASVDPMALLTVTGPIFIALITGWFANKQAQKRAGVDAVGSVQQGFQILIGELQKENVKLIDRLERQSTKMDEQTRKIGDLEEEMREMGRHIYRLERALGDAGMEVPMKANR